MAAEHVNDGYYDKMAKAQAQQISALGGIAGQAQQISALGGIAVPKRVSPIQRLIEAVDYLEKASYSVNEVGGAIAGSYPVDGAKSEEGQCANGLMAQMEIQSERINKIASAILTETGRIRSAL